MSVPKRSRAAGKYLCFCGKVFAVEKRYCFVLLFLVYLTVLFSIFCFIYA